MIIKMICVLSADKRSCAKATACYLNYSLIKVAAESSDLNKTFSFLNYGVKF